MIDVVPFGVTGHNTNDRSGMSVKGSIEEIGMVMLNSLDMPLEENGAGNLLDEIKKSGK